MSGGTESTVEFGISLSVPIPTDDPGLFTHKSTDDILLFLSRHRFEEYSLSELADRIDHPKQSVGRAVDVLVANDLLVETRDGTRRLVRINRDRLAVPDDPILRIPQVEFHDPVKAARDALLDRLDDVIGIVLYGSVARGDADRRSDIDLWVLVHQDRAANQRAANTVARDLEDRPFDGDRYAYDIDVEAVGSLPAYTDDVREIVRSGIALYETDHFATVQKLLTEGADDE